MSEQTVKVARDHLDAFNRADWAGLKGTLASDSVYDEHGTQRHVEGPDAIVEVFKAWKTAMPDVTGTVSNVLSNGDSVALELTWEGTQTGALDTPSGPIAASGKHQKTPGMWSIDVKEGKVKSSRQYFDMLTFLQQIGAARA
jgi:steroid delta-isomerase-like uncharacterized protein